MMYKIFSYIISVLLLANAHEVDAQQLPDGLRNVYTSDLSDTAKSNRIDDYLNTMERDAMLREGDLLIKYFKEKGDQVGHDYAQLKLSNFLSSQGDYAMAVRQGMDILSRFEARNDSLGILKSRMALSIAYGYAKDLERTIYFDRKVLELVLARGVPENIANAYNNISTDFSVFGNTDSALFYGKLGLEYAKKAGDRQMISLTSGTLGEAYIAIKEFELATPLIRTALADITGGASFGKRLGFHRSQRDAGIWSARGD